MNLIQEDILYCQRLAKKYGKTYYTATLFLPKKTRDAILVLYAFFRVPDELVDNPAEENTDAKEAIATWIAAWEETTLGQKSHDPVLRATKAVFETYAIPQEYAKIFLEAMQRDTYQSRYQTYAELESYMYGSAVVVGYIISHVIGFEDGALPYAKKLGEAMQLTNFLRDIKEDYAARGRIYFPKEELDQFGITELYFKNELRDEKWQAFMSFQCDRAQKLYTEAIPGIALLRTKARVAVKLSAYFYEHILRKIEKVQYDVFTYDTNLSVTDKMKILFKLYAR